MWTADRTIRLLRTSIWHFFWNPPSVDRVTIRPSLCPLTMNVTTDYQGIFITWIQINAQWLPFLVLYILHVSLQTLARGIGIYSSSCCRLKCHCGLLEHELHIEIVVCNTMHSSAVLGLTIICPSQDRIYLCFTLKFLYYNTCVIHLQLWIAAQKTNILPMHVYSWKTTAFDTRIEMLI